MVGFGLVFEFEFDLVFAFEFEFAFFFLFELDLALSLATFPRPRSCFSLLAVCETFFRFRKRALGEARISLNEYRDLTFGLATFTKPKKGFVNGGLNK